MSIVFVWYRPKSTQWELIVLCSLID
jgi:hypothetical protein